MHRVLITIYALVMMAAMPARAEGVSSFSLDNGLQVVVIEDHRAPTIVQMIWYRAGAADEPPGKSGIAHFLEHLMFKGTDRFPAGALTRIVEENGGEDNAFTSWDYTGYYQRIAADRLPLIMDMEADRMQNLHLDEETVRTERQVILEERAQRTDSNPGALLGEQINAALFLNNHYGIPVIGWRHEMQALTRQDALDWYKRYYAPNNATLIIAGDVDPDYVQKLAVKYYGAIPASKTITPRDRPQEPPPIAARRVTYIDQRVSNPYIYRLYLAPPRRSGKQDSAAALAMLAAILGGDGQTAYLARALQFDSHIAVQTSAYYSGTTVDDTMFGILVVPQPGIDLATAEKALDDALTAFLNEGIDPDALAREKTRFRANEIYRRDNARGLAQIYGEALSVGLSLQDVPGFSDAISALTSQDVEDAARLVLDPKASVTGWLVQPESTSGQAAPPPENPVTIPDGMEAD